MKFAIVIAAALALSPLALAAASAQTPPAASVQPSTADSQKAEAAFRTTWTALVAGEPDYSTMEAPLADAVKAQSASMKGLSAQIGAIKTMDYLGATPAGVQQFRVTFDRAVLNGGLRIDSVGKIDTMWLKPAS